MKTTILRQLLALLALCSAIVLPAAEYSVQAIPARIQANGTQVTAGTPRVMVALRLGSPSAVLPDGSWLYHGYSARKDGDTLLNNGTLVVRFHENRVTSLAVADHKAVLALRQAPRRIMEDSILTAANDRR
jgi:hypothetical protein